MTFSQLGLIPPLLGALDALHYDSPTPIQSQAIPVVLKGSDLLASAQTGTGKTAGFALPILQALASFSNSSASPARHPTRALILLPTRELAVQVYESFVEYGQNLDLRIGCVYGGVDIAPQTAILRAGVEILIATPGRLLDHHEQKNVFLNQLTHFVLDEADRMLDMGFLPDITRIMNLLPARRQTLLFSATFSKEIRILADRLLKNPVMVEVARANAVAETISHQVFLVDASQKASRLVAWLKDNTIRQALIFVDTKIGCERLNRYLRNAQISAAAIHGDKDQAERLSALESFKQGDIQFLVATDVAARGLDIENLPQVINYSLPNTPEDYIHRIGRTGRCGNSGSALSLVSSEEEKKLVDIEKLIGKPIVRAVMSDHGQSDGATNRGHRRRGERQTADYVRSRKIGEASLDFNVEQPFVCINSEFPKERARHKRIRTRSKPLSALLGGKSAAS